MEPFSLINERQISRILDSEDDFCIEYEDEDSIERVIRVMRSSVVQRMTSIYRDDTTHLNISRTTSRQKSVYEEDAWKLNANESIDSETVATTIPSLAPSRTDSSAAKGSSFSFGSFYGRGSRFSGSQSLVSGVTVKSVPMVKRQSSQEVGNTAASNVTNILHESENSGSEQSGNH